MKHTALHETHLAHDARMVDFAGWDMPVQYGSILDEVRCVRERAGLFDLSHMGRVLLDGPDAVALAEKVCTNFVARIPEGSIRYSIMCDEKGGAIDDVLVYKEEADNVFLVVNASNTDAVLEWLRLHKGDLQVDIDDLTEEMAMIALQGPLAEEVLADVIDDCDLADIGYYQYGFATICGMTNERISRTGYTGENGFELYIPAVEAARVWAEIHEAGRERGVMPCGLGSRDTLRLEAGMCLYGHEIDREHNPIEAGLKFGISFKEEKGDYIGRAALQAIHAAPTRKLVGIRTDGKRVPRQGHQLYQGDREVGTVCSGSVSPTIGSNIGSAYVQLGFEKPGTELELDFRGKRQTCTVQDLPFYSRTRK